MASDEILRNSISIVVVLGMDWIKFQLNKSDECSMNCTTCRNAALHERTLKRVSDMYMEVL